jgi:hypothetical protein
MFCLTDEDLKGRILGCGDGPASFNSEMNKRGCRVISADPIYQFDTKEILQRIEDTYDEVIKQMHREKDKFVWNVIKSVEELVRIRMAAMREFLHDYEQGKNEGRYLAKTLPTLPFEDRQFDLALCSHFLFLYTHQLSLDFHHEAISEMIRVAKELRIFPLLDLDGTLSPYVDIIIMKFENNGNTVQIESVPYEFQRGGNKMLKIKAI